MNLKFHVSLSTASAIIATLGSILLAQFVAPDIYGEFATLLAVCAVISALASGRVETALFAAEDEDLHEILFIGIFNSFIASTCIYLFVLLLMPIIAPSSYSKSFELLPLFAFIASSNQCWRAFDAKRSSSKHIEPIKLLSVVVNYVSIMLIGIFFNLTALSLMIAAISSQLCSFFLYYLLNKINLDGICWKHYITNYIPIIKKLKSHIIQDVPSATLNILGQQAQIIALSLLVSSESAGFYSLAKKPFVAVSQFFIPPVASHVRNIFLGSNNMIKDFSKQSKMLSLLSISSSGAAFLAAFFLLKIINPAYEQALIFTTPFLILSFFKNWISPLTSYLYIIGEIKANLVGQIYYFVASIIPIPLLIIMPDSIGMYAYFSALSISSVYIHYFTLVRSYSIKLA